MAHELRTRVDAYGAGRFQYVALNMVLGEQPYQIVARLMYSDELQERPHSVIGFTVNLDWIRRSYFGELLSQAAPLDSESSFHIGVIDDNRAASLGNAGWPSRNRERVPTCIFECFARQRGLAPLAPPKLWQILMGRSRDSPGMSASRQIWRSNPALLVRRALCLFVALIIAGTCGSSGYGGGCLATDFVSSVTHSLKMPLANISVIADTLALRPFDG